MKQELIPDSLLDALKAYSPTLVQAIKTILQEKVTKYPILVAVRDYAKIGVPVILGEDHKKEWNINMSSAEEFFTKKIMTQEAVDQFRKVYKDPLRFFCVFLVETEEIKMIYVPIDRQFIHQK